MVALESELGLCDSVMVRGLENRCWKGEIKNRRKCSLKSQAKILEEPMWKGKSVFILLWRAISGNYIKEHFFIGRTIPNGLESMSAPHPREAEEARGCVGRSHVFEEEDFSSQNFSSLHSFCSFLSHRELKDPTPSS